MSTKDEILSIMEEHLDKLLASEKLVEKGPTKLTVDKMILVASKAVVNPPRGDRHAYLQSTITLAPEVEAALRMIGVERKVNKQPNYRGSEILREAVSFWLKHQVQSRNEATATLQKFLSGTVPEGEQTTI